MFSEDVILQDVLIRCYYAYQSYPPLQVKQGSWLVQRGPAGGPKMSCCGQQGAGRQTAVHWDSTDTLCTTPRQEVTTQHASINGECGHPWRRSGLLKFDWKRLSLDRRMCYSWHISTVKSDSSLTINLHICSGPTAVPAGPHSISRHFTTDFIQSLRVVVRKVYPMG